MSTIIIRIFWGVTLNMQKVFTKKKKRKKEKSKSEKNGLVKSALSYLCYYASINYRISMYENVSLNFDGPIYY